MKNLLVILLFVFCLSACDSDNQSAELINEFVPECVNTEGDSFISGTVDFYDMLNFTGSELLIVDLEDTTLEDVSATNKASLCLQLTKETTQPIEFKLFYNSTQIENGNNYNLQVKFYELPQDTSYKLKYINEESIPVLTQGFGSYVTVVLSEAKGG